jgi:steroid 5-alpha reductase family enzyme
LTWNTHGGTIPRMEITQTVSSSRPRAFLVCLLAYVLAITAAVMLGHALNDSHPILIAFWADITATLVIYVFSQLFKNSSFYDPYWSIAPLAMVIYWTYAAMPTAEIGARQIIVILLVFIWGIRLTLNWASKWQGLKHEDWRYSQYRTRYKGWFWLIDLVGIELMPTAIVFLGCLSLYPVLNSGVTSPGILDVLFILVTLAAIIIESTADKQLKDFLNKSPCQREIMRRGLWAYSRHPNYFGEILFWWGLYLLVLTTNWHFWWTVIGPLMITILFLTVSIPLMDKRSLTGRFGYAEHMNKVPALIPWFPKK